MSTRNTVRSRRLLSVLGAVACAAVAAPPAVAFDAPHEWGFTLADRIHLPDSVAQHHGAAPLGLVNAGDVDGDGAEDLAAALDGRARCRHVLRRLRCGSPASARRRKPGLVASYYRLRGCRCCPS